jgi:hypothetical protein
VSIFRIPSPPIRRCGAREKGSHKRFGDKLISWIIHILQSSQINILINGHQIPYFKCKKDLDRETPYLPFSFNLAVNTLAKILNKAKHEGHLKCLGNFNNQNIINLNYVYDTLLFLQGF